MSIPASLLPLLLLGCSAVPKLELVELEGPPPDPRRVEPRAEAIWSVHPPDAPAYELRGRPVGRDAYAVDRLPEALPYDEVWVVTVTRGSERDFLSFVFVQADGRRGIALFESVDGEGFRLAAEAEDAPGAWDWAVVSPDGQRVAVWGRPLDVYEREGERLVFRSTLGEGFVKAFPRFGATGRLVARLVGGQDGTQAVLVDEVVGPAFDRVAPPFFDESGAHVIHGARRTGESFLVVDDVPFGPYEELRLHEASRPGWIVTFDAKLGGRWSTYGVR